MGARIFFASLVMFFATSAWSDVTVYTDRAVSEFAEAGLLFTSRTGERVHWVEVESAKMADSVLNPGALRAADVVISKDLVYLPELTSRGVFQPMALTNSAEQSVAPAFRHPDRLFVALTLRPRTMVYSSDEVAKELSTYEDLAEPRWHERLCLRSSSSSYNQALVAFLIAKHGKERATQIVSGWVKNLAAPVYRNDRAILDAVANGECDVGIVNTYYLAGKISESPAFPVKIFFANQGQDEGAAAGVHVNGIAAGIATGSPNPVGAQQLIEFLLEKDAQLSVSAAHLEYPARTDVAPNTLIKDWPRFVPSALNWMEIGTHLNEVKDVTESAGYL